MCVDTSIRSFSCCHVLLRLLLGVYYLGSHTLFTFCLHVQRLSACWLPMMSISSLAHLALSGYNLQVWALNVSKRSQECGNSRYSIYLCLACTSRGHILRCTFLPSLTGGLLQPSDSFNTQHLGKHIIRSGLGMLSC